MSSRSSVGRWLRRGFVVAALAFLAFALYDEWPKVHRSLDQLGAGAAALSLLPVLVGLAASALAWRAVLADLGNRLPVRPTLRIFFVGQLGKYLPGSVWPVLAQAQLGREHGLQRRRVATVALVVMGLNVATALLVGAALFPFASGDVFDRYWWILLLVPVALAALHPRVLTRVVGLGLRLLRRPPLEHAFSVRGVAGGVGWSVVMWGCYGAQVWLLADRLGAHGAVLPALATGGFALAWLVGFLIVIAPAGAGAREVVLVLVLAPVLATGPATALALVSRAVMTVGDLLWGLAGLLGGVPPAASPSYDDEPAPQDAPSVTR